ncbi:unnamed protein product [Moneuplotes crassus]|uniref:Uncharacterized protein n=1 Tax=Euplotes crassus TaxID=5936 RepID=A0AAD1Y7J4_EUPCR|nr:unnamed protein product [Moneuplotes crassus]
MRKNSKFMTGYAADLINLSHRKSKIPSVIDGKKIKSTLSPLFRQNKNSRRSFAAKNPFKFGRDRSSITSTVRSNSNSNFQSHSKGRAQKSSFAHKSLTKQIKASPTRRPSRVEELQMEYEKSNKEIAKLRHRNSIILNFIPIKQESSKEVPNQPTDSSVNNVERIQGVQGSTVSRTGNYDLSAKEETDQIDSHIPKNDIFQIGQRKKILKEQILSTDKLKNKVNKRKRQGNILTINHENLRKNFRKEINENTKTEDGHGTKTVKFNNKREKSNPIPLNNAKNCSKDWNKSRSVLKSRVKSPNCCKRKKFWNKDNLKSCMSDSKNSYDLDVGISLNKRQEKKTSALRKRGKDIKIRSIKRRDKFKTIKLKQRTDTVNSPQNQLQRFTPFSPISLNSRISSTRKRNPLSPNGSRLKNKGPTSEKFSMDLTHNETPVKGFMYFYKRIIA